MIIVRNSIKCKKKWNIWEEIWNAQDDFRIEKEDMSKIAELDCLRLMDVERRKWEEHESRPAR